MLFNILILNNSKWKLLRIRTNAQAKVVCTPVFILQKTCENVEQFSIRNTSKISNITLKKESLVLFVNHVGCFIYSFTNLHVTPQ